MSDKKDKRNRGNYSPSLASKKEYRDDMASLDYGTEEWRKHKKIASGKTPRRYYKNFDRGAKRYEKRKSRRSGKR